MQVATDLARRTSLDQHVAFRQGDALALPFEAARFDGVTMLHVGMNIPDKQTLFAGVRRVLRPGGTFAVYDVMRTAAGDLSFPVPWAARPDMDFMATVEAYRAALEGAGFDIVAQRDRANFALDFFRTLQARAAQQSLPPLGLPILMGDNAPQKIGNMIGNLQRGLISPTEIIARVPAG